MRPEIARWFGVVLSCLVLAACGGGDPGPAGSAAFVASIAATPAAEVQQRSLADTSHAVRPSARATALRVVGPTADPRRTALALGPNDPVDATATLDWAEWKYPELFPKGPGNVTLDYQGVRYTVRSYANGNNLGITSAGGIWGLGPFTGQALITFGTIDIYEALVRADRCSVYPGSCDSGGGGNTLNECQPLSINSLVAGARIRAEYQVSGVVTGTQLMESVVNGPTTFNGQNAVLLTSSVTSTLAQAGQVFSNAVVTRTYLQGADGGLVRTLGDEDGTMVNGQATFTRRRVFDPPYVDNQFTLARGGVLTQTLTGTDTPLQGPGTATRFSDTTVITFVAREPLTVLGKTYDTCRYTERDESNQATTTFWHHVGTGLPVRFDADGVTADLRAGSIDGVPL